VLCCAVLCCAVLCCAVLCCAVLCCAVLCCAVLCCAVLCCAVLFVSAPVLRQHPRCNAACACVLCVLCVSPHARTHTHTKTTHTQVVSTRFTKSVIASRAALTYKQAQERIDDAAASDEVSVGEAAARVGLAAASAWLVPASCTRACANRVHTTACLDPCTRMLTPAARQACATCCACPRFSRRAARRRARCSSPAPRSSSSWTRGPLGPAGLRTWMR
jgi:hypothetical protein